MVLRCPQRAPATTDPCRTPKLGAGPDSLNVIGNCCKVNMNLAAHNPEFSDGCSITELLSRIASQASQLASKDKQIRTQASQLASRNKQIVDLTSQNADLIKQMTENEEQFAKEKTAYLQ